MRRCPRCATTKPHTAFYRDASKPSGYRSICRDCDRAKSRRYYAANRERVIARVRATQSAA